MSIKKIINSFQTKYKNKITLIAVSKQQSSEKMIEAYKSGQRDFGENRVQELIKKAPLFPNDIRWHMIGHVQTNKVKFLAPFVYMIHSVDSLKLLNKLNAEANNNDRIIKCLLQIHIAEEIHKFGFNMEELDRIFTENDWKDWKNIKISGLMGMATFTNDMQKIRQEFQKLKEYFDILKEKFFNDTDYFKELSMGMSNDYDIAVEEGATMLRIGSLIFGNRN